MKNWYCFYCERIVLERKAIRYWILIIQNVFKANRKRLFLDCDKCWIDARVVNCEIEFSLNRGGCVLSRDSSYFHCVIRKVTAR